MTVLIITHSQDNDSVSMVMGAIEAQGGKVFRFDTDRFPTDIQLDIRYGWDKVRMILATPDKNLDLFQVSAVWYRRIAMGQGIPVTMNKQFREASIQESHATVQGMLASLEVFQLDPVANIRRAEHKQLQLQVARALGLEVPRTLISNDPAAVRAFARECRHGMITKMFSSFAIYEAGEERVVFTNAVTPEDLDNLDGLRYCPMTFQEQVPKALELRTTIVGGSVFTAAVNSQRLAQARQDWRRQGVALLEDWELYTLPQEVTDKLLALMDYFDLNYGAIDIILTPDGRHVFLEVNPAGEFFWLEQCPGLPISQAIAEVLLSRSGR